VYKCIIIVEIHVNYKHFNNFLIFCVLVYVVAVVDLKIMRMKVMPPHTRKEESDDLNEMVVVGEYVGI